MSSCHTLPFEMQIHARESWQNPEKLKMYKLYNLMSRYMAPKINIPTKTNKKSNCSQPLNSCVCICACVYGCTFQRSMMVASHGSPPCFSRQGLTLNLELTPWFNWLASKSQNPPVFIFPELGLQTCCQTLFPTWILGIPIRTYTATILLTELPPPSRQLLYP